MTEDCPIGGAERCEWRTFVPRTESDSEDSFSDDPDEWTDPLENDWRCEGRDDGVCFFDWYYQGCRCQWAADWDRPITECQARVNTPTTKLLLEIAKGGQLFALAISEDGLTAVLRPIFGSGVTLIYVGKYQPAWELAPAAMAASTRRKTMTACLPARLSLSLSVFVFLLSLPAND